VAGDQRGAGSIGSLKRSRAGRLHDHRRARARVAMVLAQAEHSRAFATSKMRRIGIAWKVGATGGSARLPLDARQAGGQVVRALAEEIGPRLGQLAPVAESPERAD
jgi:hypothetical protein